MKKASAYERFMALTDAEKDREVARFDRKMDLRELRPLTPALRRRVQQAKRKRGRPRIGGGTRKVLVSIERGLLREADAAARQQRISRSQLFTRGLNAVLRKAG